MKTLHNFLFIILTLVSFAAYPQAANRAAASTWSSLYNQDTSHYWVYLDTNTTPAFSPYLFRVLPKDVIRWKILNVTNLQDSLTEKVNVADMSGILTNYLLFNGNGSSLTGLTQSQVGLSNVDNTSDANKPVSIATNAALMGKFNNPSGTTSQYLRGDGSLATFPALSSGTVTSVTAGTGLSGGTITTTGTISLPNTGTAGTYGQVTTDAQGRVTAGKRVETYSGTTNGSGQYTVTFSVAYSSSPNIQANIIGGSDTQIIRITSVSTTAFTVTVRNRTDVVGLLPTWANVSGASVDVLITEK